MKCDPKVGEAAPVFKALRPKIEERYAELVDEMNLTGYTLEWGGEYEDSIRTAIDAGRERDRTKAESVVGRKELVTATDSSTISRPATIISNTSATITIASPTHTA